MFIKWKLILTTLPYVAVAVGIKLLLQFVGHYEGVVDFSDISMVLTGGIFLIGFMLAGVITDFKESEKIPGELACALETIEETFSQAAVSKPALDKKRLLQSVLDASNEIRAWLFRTKPQTEMYKAIEDLDEAAKELEKAGATPLGIRAVNEISGLRKLTTRIGVISRTGFLSSGYALLETMTAVVLVLLMISKFKNNLAEIILVAFVTLIYIYMYRLIKDIDDPFEYSPEGQTGAAEVELFPFIEYQERLTRKIGQLNQ
jgi:hypothetical protein